jgi:serine O-acetyltransferase
MTNFSRAFEQAEFLGYELALIANKRWWRWFTMWFGGSAGVIVSYRIDRFFYLLLGKAWAGLRVLFFPVFLILSFFSARHEIHYKANIGKGLKILHPVLGVVISGLSIIGSNLILAGGNCIGSREEGPPLLGNNILMGANAVILGPVKIGNNVSIGAGAIVVKDAIDGAVLISTPAHPVS